jgi:S-disulfanyl-L-cysteine oxidoreductase SoxD
MITRARTIARVNAYGGTTAMLPVNPRHTSMLAISVVLGLQASVTPPSAADSAGTAASLQIAAGAGAYATQCAACHGENLAGSNHAPALKGAVFGMAWAEKPSRLLYSRIISTMPLTDPGTLAPKMVLDITTFILSVNKQLIPDGGYQKADELNSIPIKQVD